MSWSKEKMDEVYARIQEKAIVDAAFRKALLADPNAVIEKEAGISLPKGFKINIVESDPAYQATYVLPPMTDGALSEDDLDKVAGGVNLLQCSDNSPTCGSFRRC